MDDIFMGFSGVPWNDRNDTLSCNSTEFSRSEDIDLWTSQYSANCFSQIAVTSEEIGNL